MDIKSVYILVIWLITKNVKTIWLEMEFVIFNVLIKKIILIKEIVVEF